MNNDNIFPVIDADRNGYAIPAFNYSDIWEMQAIVEAAREERAIVFIASNMRVVDSLGLNYLAAIGEVAYQSSSGHVFNHLDHSNSVELCKKAVDAGYRSVMIDASMFSIEENIAKTREVVRYAHAKGVKVEAEMGRILGRNEEGKYHGNDYLVQVEDAVRLTEETGIDSLAIGIGTAHGFYQKDPEINIERLNEVNAVVKIPLVLHGGTGVPAAVVKACIQNGIAKVNVGTELHAAYINAVREKLHNFNTTSISDLMEPIKSCIKPIVKDWIRICNANNRY